jgi:hypothetical protein
MRRRFLNNIKSISDDNHSEYFSIEALEDGLTASLSQNACEYRIGNGSWNNLSAGSNTPSINKGQTLSFRGSLTPTSSNGIGTFTISKKCNLKGNIMSLLYSDDFEGQNDLTGKTYAFYNLFYNCKTIVNASELILLATTLANYCYDSMFYGCKGLTTAPELPATTLANYCYQYMFYGCTGLTASPALPATTLSYRCYECMFGNTNVLPDCSNIDFSSESVVKSNGLRGLFGGTKVTDADLERILPKNNEGKYCLPATTLANTCYYDMFKGCTSLTTAPELPATTLSSDCYYNMFKGCTSLTTAPELPATTLKKSCYGNMFNGCVSLTESPALPATTLEWGCYKTMFEWCTSLTEAPELPATTLADSCYKEMFHGCSNLNYIKMLATDISANSCLDSWVNGVASSGTFVKHPSMTTLPSGVSGIPSGWTVEDYVEKIDYSKEYFTIEAVEDELTASLSTNACEYRIDNGSWNNLSAVSNTPSINKGQT